LLIGRGVCALLLTVALMGCENDENGDPPDLGHPECARAPSGRVDAHTPQSVAADWEAPVRLGDPINTPCLEDAVEISRDGRALYFLFTTDLVENLDPEDLVARPNGTYRAANLGAPEAFDVPEFYDLGKGAGGSLDGELSFAPDGSRVYFHSLRGANTGYHSEPPVDDPVDIYEAPLANGVPGAGVNLGVPVNSAFADGEQAIHPDGVSLYFASSRPGGAGGLDLWVAVRDGGTWGVPALLGGPVNTPANELQPAFTADGDTMYFASDRDEGVGMAIYRSHRAESAWSEPELVLRGIVGEPSLTADGRTLYFVHVLTDAAGPFDADIWYCGRAGAGAHDGGRARR